MSNVDFKEIADGVANGSESRASSPEAKKLIRALLKADPGEVPYGEFRDFVKAIVEGKPEHASYSYRDLVKAVVSGKASLAPSSQRDLAAVLVRRYGTENRSRGLSGGLDRDALVALDEALRSHSERDVDWPELRALAAALLNLDPYKAPTNGWRGFVEALRKRDPDAAASPLDQIARAAILRDPGRAPSGWPRSLAELLIRNRIPEPMTVVSAESDSDLRNMAHALENGNAYAVSNLSLRGIVEAVQKRDPHRASDRFRGFVEALLKGDPSRAPKGEMQEIAKAVVKKRPGDLPSGPLRDLAIALVEALEPPPAPPAAVAGARSASSRTGERGKASAPSGQKNSPVAQGVFAAMLSNDPEKASPGIARWIAAGLLAADSVDAKGSRPPERPGEASGGRSPAMPLSPVSEPTWAGDGSAAGDPETSGAGEQSLHALYLRALEDLPSEFSPGRLAAVGHLRVAGGITFRSVREHVCRCYLRILENVARQGLVPGRLAETLIGLDEPLGLRPEESAILRAAAIDALTTAKVRDDIAPEVRTAYVERVRELLGVPPRDAPVAGAAPGSSAEVPRTSAPEPVATTSSFPGERQEEVRAAPVVQPPSPPAAAPPPPSPPPPVPAREGLPAGGPVQAPVPKPRRLVVAAMGVLCAVLVLGAVARWAGWQFPGIAALNAPAQAPVPEPRVDDVAKGTTPLSTELQEAPPGTVTEVASDSATTEGTWSQSADLAPGEEVADQGLVVAPGDPEATEPSPAAHGDADRRNPDGVQGTGTATEAAATNPSATAPTGGALRSATPAELAWDEGDWTTAFRLYLQAAARGDLEAEVRLGRMYYDGLGRPADPQAAEAWFRKAAGKGNAEAKYRLGLLYSDNRPNAPWDLDVARKLFIEAAGTHAMAALKLGHYYAKGIGVPENHEEARRWFQQAERLGNAEAADWLRSNR